MANKRTMYLAVPKEQAAADISKYKHYEVDHEDSSNEEIIIRRGDGTLRAEIVDYAIPEERIKEQGLSLETGQVGCRVDYYHNDVRGQVEEHVLWG